MKLKHIFKNNIIKNVINIIKKMLESFAVIKKIIFNKLQIQEKQLKIKINYNSKNSNNKLKLENTLQISCDKNDYINYYYNLCNIHI